MKDPREILLEQHRAAEPKLDLVRRRVLERQRLPAHPAQQDLLSAPAPRLVEAPSERPFDGLRAGPKAVVFALFEFLVPFRRHLAGLGAVWAVIALLQMANGAARPSTSAPGVAKAKSPSPRELFMSLQEHRRQLLQWINPADHQPPGVPQAETPRRPTERHPYLNLA